MNYMFKDIQILKSIEMISKNDTKITSMISSFENFFNLESFTIEGFNIIEAKNLSKLFYNCPLEYINLDNFETNNIIDMSYMFANTNLKELDLSRFNTENVENISHIWKIVLH